MTLNSTAFQLSLQQKDKSIKITLVNYLEGLKVEALILFMKSLVVFLLIHSELELLTQGLLH